MLYNAVGSVKDISHVGRGWYPSFFVAGQSFRGRAFRRLDTRFGVVATLPFKRPSERREVLERGRNRH